MIKTIKFKNKEVSIEFIRTKDKEFNIKVEKGYFHLQLSRFNMFILSYSDNDDDLFNDWLDLTLKDYDKNEKEI